MGALCSSATSGHAAGRLQRHDRVGTNDFEKAKGFYDSLFETIGASRILEFDRICAWSRQWGQPLFGVALPYDGVEASVGNGTMISLLVDDRAKVDALHGKAVALGGRCEGRPGLRGEEGPQAFYAAYFRDLDGNKLCAFRMGAA
ncbi:VOC family protein [Sphingomonas oleivorans]|uniref:VOC family protein n=1 Tax=Sphingomonas oleivorans TaxID=1735121 RepID=UPI001FAFB3F6|nr:VOC family protein [Sphingomonas oleivorans]